MELNFKSFGMGAPVVILHGLFGMLDNWQTFARKLSENFEVYILDLRNHGRSPHSDDHNYSLMARDMYDFMTDQNLFSAHIIGHSMGGKTAMQFASFYPGFVRKLVVIDIFPKQYNKVQPEHEEIFKAIDAVVLNKFTKRIDAEECIAGILPDLRIKGFLAKSLSLSTEGYIKWKFNASALRNQYQNLSAAPEIKGKIPNKTLLIKGGHSGYITQEDENSAANFFINARIETIPNAGHWVQVDAPELLFMKIKNFLME